MKEFANNRKAFYDYIIIEKYEAGIKLLGSEVKPIINSKIDIKNAFVKIIKNEAFLFESYIQNENTTYFYLRHKENRDRKLLLNKKEITKLQEYLNKNQHSTIIPLKVYYSETKKIKVEIALAKGKKNYDKKLYIKERELSKQKDF